MSTVFHLDDVPVRTGSGYPEPFDAPCRERAVQKLGDHGGLDQFGVSRITLPPGAWSSQRHWHSAEDELVIVVEGQPTLITDGGQQVLGPGSVTAHKAGDADGHHMINETDAPVVYLVVGARRPHIDTGHYPDIDLHLPANGTPVRHYERKSGEPYAPG